MNKVLTILIVFGLVLSSCITTSNPNPTVNYSYPQAGSTNNATLVVKDYEPVGIIFVKSSEVVDNNGNHTGSKITYEMLMTEAQKLNADDVINIKIDVNRKDEIEKTDNYGNPFSNNYGNAITKTTYSYTATALAIKYTSSIPVASSNNNSQELGNAGTTIPAGNKSNR